MADTSLNKNFNVQISRRPDEPRIHRVKRGICGAKTRKGTPCNAPPVWNKVTDKAKNGRCKLHGGLSTGAKTEAGRQAIGLAVGASNRRRIKKTKKLKPLEGNRRMILTEPRQVSALTYKRCRVLVCRTRCHWEALCSFA